MFRRLALGSIAALGLVHVFSPFDTDLKPGFQSVPDPRFGVIEAYDAPARADDLGVGWSRARLHWSHVQPSGPDDWIEAELTEGELNRELASGREVVGLLIGLPDWARGDDALPRGLNLPVDDPNNLWAGFVREAVSRYRGRIDHWIIWNEPDVWDSDHPGFTWPGSEGDYIRLLKVAYFAAKDSNPSSSIHLAAVSHWWDTLYGRELYFRRLMAALTADPDAVANNYYYDAATLHLYFNPASVYELIELYSTIQVEYGIEKPIWLLETNAAPSSDPAWNVPDPSFKVSLLEQAAYMPQALSLSLAAGAQRVALYKLIDTPGDYAANPEPFGLVRADNSLRPAYRTAQVAISQLTGADRIEWVDRHSVAQVVIHKQSDVIRVLWSRLPFAQAVEVPSLAAEATLLDMWGNETHLEPDNGTYSLVLLAGECQETTADYCMIGGPVAYLIEQGRPDADKSLAVAVRPFEGSLVDDVSTMGRMSLFKWLVSALLGFALAAAGIIIRLRMVRAV